MSGTIQSGLARMIDMAKFTVSEVIFAYILALLVAGGSPITLAKIVLAMKLNVFAIPLIPALDLAPVVWYVIVVMWLRQWLWYSPYGVDDIIAELEEAWEARETAERTPERTAATDGGSEEG